MDPKCTKKNQLEKSCRSSITSSTGVASESLKIRLWVIRAKCDNSWKWWWLSLCSIEGEEKHMDTSQVQINQLNPYPVTQWDLLASIICTLERKLLHFIGDIFKVLSLQSNEKPVSWFFQGIFQIPPAISHSVQPLLPASRCSLAVS